MKSQLFLFAIFIFFNSNVFAVEKHSIETFKKDLFKGDAIARSNAAAGLGGIKGEQSCLLLIKALDDEVSEVKFSVLESLGGLNCRESKNRLSDIHSDALNNEDYHDKKRILMAVAATLWRLGENKYSKTIYNFLESDNPTDRADAVLFLRYFDNKEVLDILGKILMEDDFFPAAFGAAYSLGAIGNVASLPVLQKSLKKKGPNLSGEIEKAINKIKKKNNL